MPRGLGEDPLSRKKRTRASGRIQASATSEEAASVSAPEQMTVQGSAASSYNEVFFHRRETQSEGSATPSSPANGAGPVVESSGPQPPAIATAVSDTQQTAPADLGVVSPSEERIEAITLSPPVEAPAPPAEPISQVEVPAPQEAPSVQPAAEKRGLLSRFFGKLRK